ncbi:AraC family transcriptional regulator [Arsukibacterium indicum]|uniref:AraC family transcriptional regulator n=1 Tax=Arsukibacterium indicum TaxID=2848612 RepID=A0ABS6MHQ0_9GAMM|nr:AraC family transcriptional regulator [Arsukibacterium indicum]MBV2128318.1 AraC family transcriptional regulator [Arsukibacterium indicum]
MNCYFVRSVLLSIMLLAMPSLSAAATTEPPAEQQLEQLKQQAIALNRELFILEEELLFPPQTQLAVFVSVDAGSFFQLDSIQLKLNDEAVDAHLYTASELEGLARGAIQPLYKGNIRAGEHTLTAVFVGIGPEERDYRRAISHRFTKADEAVLLELKITDSSANYQPDFSVEVWSGN